MSFEVEIGQCSQRGVREVNEDFAAATRSASGDPVRGVIAAIADGVSGGGRGLEAAQTSVLGLLADFFATPPTWETSVALDRLMGAQNGWLVAQNRQRAGATDATALTTLSALVLQGQGWTVAHVGDTRIWRIAGGQITQLTQDHAFAQPDQRNRLTRAVGLDDLLHADHLQGEAHLGDRFVLTSDGVHGVLRPRRLGEIAARGSAQQASEALVEAALAAGSKDNVTALVLQVIGLDAATLSDETARIRHLPPLPRLRVGDAVDGFTITALVADTGVHRLYQARDGRHGDLVAIKTLHESRAADAEERAMLAHEAWLSQRVTEKDPRGFVRSREPGDATALYTVFDWHAGQTLDQLLAQRRDVTVAEVVAGGREIASALGRLHRQGVIHRDIKPGNLHLGEDGQWRVLDLGVALSGREGAAARELHAGTPSYINPEQWAGAPPDAGSDLYALGVTLYRWLTGRLPHGEIEPYQAARYRRDPQPPSRMRPDVPIWLDHLVLKAIALDPRQRFETAEEMLLALERGASRPVSAPAATPLAARDPAALWKIALGISLLFNALLVFWLVFLPH
ncbi:MAG: bifunctional protein-serine/threonine kinase/phosphatase [Piscinibacter sp.]